MGRKRHAEQRGGRATAQTVRDRRISGEQKQRITGRYAVETPADPRPSKRSALNAVQVTVFERYPGELAEHVGLGHWLVLRVQDADGVVPDADLRPLVRRAELGARAESVAEYFAALHAAVAKATQAIHELAERLGAHRRALPSSRAGGVR